MSVLLVIPARGGSKGIARKNLCMVGGKPLIAYSIEHALAAKMIDWVIVSTEDQEIAQVARSYGAETPFERPDVLALDEVSLIPVLIHAAREMDRVGRCAELVVSLQPTAPLVSPRVIDSTVRVLQKTECDSVVTLRKVVHNHPYRVQWLKRPGCLQSFIESGESHLQKQDLPRIYSLTGGIYGRRRHILDNWSGKDFCLGSKRRGIVISDREAINIDTVQDLDLLKTMIFENETRTRKHL